MVPHAAPQNVAVVIYDDNRDLEHSFTWKVQLRACREVTGILGDNLCT